MEFSVVIAEDIWICTETYVIQWIPYLTPNSCQAIAKVSFQFSHTSNSGIMCDLCPEVKGWTLNAT